MTTKQSEADAASLIADQLLSAEPDAHFREPLMLFGQLVGSWDFEAVYEQGYGLGGRGGGEWTFGWALGGRAIIDVWRLTRSADGVVHEPPLRSGTTLRIFDPQIEAWHVAYASATHPGILTFTARRDGAEIVLSGAEPDGTPMRWIFSGITSDTFEWRYVVESEGQWVARQTMHARRRRV